MHRNTKRKVHFQIIFNSLITGESYDGWSKRGDFSDDPKSNLYSVLHKMQQFREIAEKVCQTQKQNNLYLKAISN